MGYYEDKRREYEYERRVDYYREKHGLDRVLAEMMTDREREGRMDKDPRTETWNMDGSWGGKYNH